MKTCQLNKLHLNIKICHKATHLLLLQAFYARKQFYNDKEKGYFTLKQKTTETQQPKNPMSGQYIR